MRAAAKAAERFIVSRVKHRGQTFSEHKIKDKTKDMHMVYEDKILSGGNGSIFIRLSFSKFHQYKY